MKRLSILIPDELHKEFKKIVADKETNMSEIIKDFIEKFIRDTQNKKENDEEKIEMPPNVAASGGYNN